MTSVRMSFVFTLEDTFKGGKGGRAWIAPPPGSYFSNTNTRQTSAIYTTGSKKWVTTAYGAFSGTWEWTFMLDYKYLEPFLLVFDKLNEKSVGEDGFSTAANNNTYTFSKGRTGRVPSFCVRRKILNNLVGVENKDETTILKGCVVQSISFARSATSSQYQVSMSGVYADEVMTVGELDSTDWNDYDGKQVEFSCVMLGDNIETATYVANTDSTSISITNNVSLVHNTCTPFATQYYEDRNQFQISTSCYSTDPTVYKTRVYSGGSDNTAKAPKSKNLTPLKKMFVASFDKDLSTANAGETLASVIASSSNSVIFTISDAVMKSMKWTNGDGSKLMDSLSSVDCKDITMTVKTDGLTDMWNHTIAESESST